MDTYKGEMSPEDSKGEVETNVDSGDEIEEEMETHLDDGRNALDIDQDRSKIDDKTLERIVEDSLVEVRDLLQGVDYTIFASTALWLHGKVNGAPDLMRVPGDLDVCVPDRATMLEVRKRFLRHDDIAIDVPPAGEGDGPFFVSKLDGALIMKGYIKVDGLPGGQNYDYPFEMFVDSFAVSKYPYDRQKVDGLNTLSMEGLRNSYKRNLEIESRMKRDIVKVEAFIRSDLEELFKNGDESVEVTTEHLDAQGHVVKTEADQVSIKTIAEHLDLNDEDLLSYYKMIAWLESGKDDEGNEIDRVEIRKKLDEIIGGMKLKIDARIANIELIMSHMSASVQSKDGGGEEGREAA
jgi:hypothetical protein